MPEPAPLFAGAKPKPEYALLKILPTEDRDTARFEIEGIGSPRRLFSWLTDAEKILHLEHFQYSPDATDRYRRENPGSQDWVYVRFPS